MAFLLDGQVRVLLGVLQEGCKSSFLSQERFVCRRGKEIPMNQQDKNAYAREWRKYRKENGFCISCPKPARPGKSRCSDCGEKAVRDTDLWIARKLLRSEPVKDNRLGLWQERCTGILRYFIEIQKGSPFYIEDFTNWVLTERQSFPKASKDSDYHDVFASAKNSGMVEQVDGKWRGR